jgi:hypothetical protein
MKTKLNPVALALAAAGLISLALPAGAQTAQDFGQMRAELRALRAELEALKAQQRAAVAAPAAATAASAQVNDRLEAVELKQKDAVVGGDIPNSFRLPGSDTSIRVYGFAEANLVKDLKATAPGDTFTNLIEQPLDNSGAPKGRAVLTAQTSRFGFESSTPTSVGTFSTKVEADFYAYCGTECNRNRLRLRHAYGEYAGWLIGQTWSTFMDLDDLPETVDFNGPVGSTFRRPVQVRYTYNDPKLAKFQFALEDPSSGARRPNIVLRADKSFDWGALNVRLLSHEQRMGTLAKNGTGFGFGGSYKVTPSLTFMGQYTQADGDADGAYLVGANYPLVDAGGSLVLDKSRGVVLGLANTFSDKLRGSFALGAVRSRHDDTGAYAAAATAQGYGDNAKLYQWHLNFYYVPLKNVELGAELIGGKRTNYLGDSGTLSRFNLQARYSFN